MSEPLHIARGGPDKQTASNLSRGLWRLRRLLFHQEECSLPGGSDSKCTAETSTTELICESEESFCVRLKMKRQRSERIGVPLFHDSKSRAGVCVR